MHTVLLCRHHCWTSFEGSAEVYNEWMRETNNYNYINLKYFLKKYNSVNLRANAVGMLTQYSNMICLYIGAVQLRNVSPINWS